MESKGIFTVKSAYKLACAFRKEMSSCAESIWVREERNRMWKKV